MSKRRSTREEFASPLVELTQLLDRLEQQVSRVRQAHVETVLTPPPAKPSQQQQQQQPDFGSPTSKFRSFFSRRKSEDTSKKKTTGGPAASDAQSTGTLSADSSLHGTATTASSGAADQPPNSSDAASAAQPGEALITKPSNPSSSPKMKATFMEFPEEASVVEYLRRIAELTVMGENYAASKIKKDEAVASRDKWKAHMDILDDPFDLEPDHSDPMESNVHEADYMQLFDVFFERNVLEMIINLLTGAIFQLTPEENEKLDSLYAPPESTKPTDSEENADAEASAKEAEEEGDSDQTKQTPPTPKSVEVKQHIKLPPLSIATQALQSISILIQNVNRATSLYVILSNNRINEIINLPLNLYELAEQQRQLQAGHEVSSMAFTTHDLTELTTHFVTFLKCLAMRMNVETLQFFLKYPTEERGSVGRTIPASTSHFSDDGATDAAGDEVKENVPVEPTDPSPKHHIHVEFPLYERALEFCAAHQESFVRVTAMNICLNTLRLTTVSADTDSELEASSPSKPVGTTPGGVLHNAQPLPFRERLAIAHFSCIPSRVERLISPIFTKLAERWNALDEQIRDIERTKAQTLIEKATPLDTTGNINAAKMDPKEKARRLKLTREFKSRAADFLDELLLLEDVFKVGSVCSV